MRHLIESNGENEDFHREIVYSEGGRTMTELHCSEADISPDLNKKVFLYPRLVLQRKNDGIHTKATMCRSKNFKYVKRLEEKDEFYDLKKDPNELNNVIDEPQYQDKIMKFRMKMLEFYQETSDVVPHEHDKRFGPFDLLLLVRTAVPDMIKNKLIKKKNK